MNCPICGAFNSDSSSFCIHCGEALGGNKGVNSIPQNNQGNVVSNQPQAQTYSQPQAQPQTQPQTQTYSQPQVQSQWQAYEQVYEKEGTDNYVPPMIISDYFIYLFLILLKPYTAFKNQEGNFNTPKCPAILASIIAGIMTLVTLIKTMITTVIETHFSFSTYDYETEINFSNLADIDYISVIGKNFLVYLGMILAIAGVYFLGSLILKRQQNFARLLSISATSFISYVVLGMIASPILGLVWEPLSIFAMLIGLVYSIALFIVLINEEIKIEDKDIKIYFNVACLGAFGIIGYYVMQEILMSSVISSIGNIFG